jgi:hypothetical protein
MNDFVLGIIVGAFFFYIGLRIFLALIVKRIEDQLAELSQSVQGSFNNLIEAKVEEHNGVFYIYNNKDQSFIVQGSTMKELREAIDAKFKGINITITHGDKDVLARLMSTK